MKRDATRAQIDRVRRAIEELGYRAEPVPGRGRTAVALLGNDGRVDERGLAALDGVLRVVQVSPPYREAGREAHPEDTVVDLGDGVRIGGAELVVVAGPCAVESESQILRTAARVAAAGATLLRGGAFKPRSSPYSFQGLGEEGLRLLAAAREATGLAVVTEALDPESVEMVARYADVIQIGSRNMQNSALLRAAGRAGRPVLLKRGMAATLQELLLAAEYILVEGESRVILCERGVRGFDGHARNLLDLAAVPSVKELSHLPILVDPSHATGSRRKVPPMARAAVAAGAHGIMVEVHPDPSRAASDGAQSLDLDEFDTLMAELGSLAAAVGRPLAGARRLSRRPAVVG